jgi:hypothetical protein
MPPRRGLLLRRAGFERSSHALRKASERATLKARDTLKLELDDPLVYAIYNSCNAQLLGDDRVHA